MREDNVERFLFFFEVADFFFFFERTADADLVAELRTKRAVRLSGFFQESRNGEKAKANPEPWRNVREKFHSRREKDVPLLQSQRRN